MKADAVYHIETFKQVFRDAPFGVGVFDLQTGQSLFLNEAFYRIIEYTPEEYNAIISDDLSLLLYDQDKIITETIKKELQETGSVKNLEYRIIKKNKGISTIQVSIVIIHLDGRTCAFCYFEDVTSEREYLEHFKLIAENTDSSISLLRLNVKDKTIKLIFANDIFFKMAGGSREKYTADPESLLSLVPEEDQNNTVEAIRRSILTGKPQELEYRLYQPDHTSRWMNRHLSAIKQDEENTYLLSSIVTDITDLKQSELQIKLEQQNYQNILDNMPTGFAKIRVNPDGSSTVILVNQAFCKMIDMSYQQCMELYQDSCLAGIHPDDLEHTVEVMSGIHDGARISITHRLRKSTGSWVWVRASIYAKEEDGALMLYVNFIDLSRDLEQKIITNALLDSLLGVVIYKVTDDKVITQYYSESIEKLSGYSSSELQQQVQENILFELSIYPPDKTRVINQFHQFAKEKKPAKFTYRSFKKNRAIQWLSVSGTLIREEDGFPVYYCVLTLPPAESSLYQGVVEDSAGAVYIIERETRNIIYINKEGRNFFGIPEDTDVTGNSILNYISTNSLLLSPEEISSLEYDHFLILHKLSRDHRYFTIRAKALNWNDIDSYIIYAVDDTQEYSKAMQREKLLNQIPVGIGIYELHHEDDIKQIYMSDGFYKLLHVNPGLHKALIGNSIMRGVHPADTESIRTLIRKLKNGADYGAAEYRNLCYSGIYLWVRLVANVVRRSEDAITAYCVYEDISEAVTARENLQKMNIMLQRQYEIEQKKHEFLEHDSIAAMVFNESQDKLVEFKLKEAIPNKPFSGMNKASCLQVLFKLIPDPDDQKHVGDFFDTDRIIALFRSGITEHNVEFRLRRVNGCLHWTRINAQITENKDTGDIISYVFASDIDTEKVKMLVSEYIISDESDFILLLSTVTKKIEVLRLRSGHECPLMRNCRIFD
ncbi:MAG: PAS domain S-box protein [Erysipelotrichia bacterium]|nr:PAS domain S-box protein [Erysipelotrichia bacterium]